MRKMEKKSGKFPFLNEKRNKVYEKPIVADQQVFEFIEAGLCIQGEIVRSINQEHELIVLTTDKQKVAITSEEFWQLLHHEAMPTRQFAGWIEAYIHDMQEEARNTRFWIIVNILLAFFFSFLYFRSATSVRNKQQNRIV